MYLRFSVINLYVYGYILRHCIIDIWFRMSENRCYNEMKAKGRIRFLIMTRK